MLIVWVSFKPSLPDSRQRQKISWNFYFHTVISFWSLRRFYEGPKGLNLSFLVLYNFLKGTEKERLVFCMDDLESAVILNYVFFCKFIKVNHLFYYVVTCNLFFFTYEIFGLYWIIWLYSFIIASTECNLINFSKYIRFFAFKFLLWF